MGCTSSKVIDSSQTSVNSDKKKSPQSKGVVTVKEKDSLTVKEFFDTALTLPEQHGKPYSQPQLPNHYVQQNVTFDNENVDNKVWDMKIKINKKPKADKEKNKKKANESELLWYYRKTANKKYCEPADTTSVEVEYEQGSRKKQVAVLGGLYLGGIAASADDILEMIDVECTHSLVILGNLFDTLSTSPFHQAPSDITEIESVLAQSAPILETIRRLAEDISVYYMRGSYDYDLTRVAIERLLGDKIIYIQQKNLILSVKAGIESYRVLLTTGQQWDFLNLPDQLNANQLLVGKPIGYYIARAASANPDFSTSTLMKPVASSIPAELTKQFLQQISKRPLQDKLTERMLLSAFQLSTPEDLININCLVDEGKYISSQSILEYPYIKYLIAQHGEERMMWMLKAMVGDYSGVAKDFGEDVMITGLGDEATLSKVPTGAGHEILCASTGSCSKRSEKATMLRISYPKQGSNGKIEILYHQPAQKATQNGTTQKTTVVKDDKADTISVESI